MSDVTFTEQDRDLVDGALQHALKEAIEAVVRARNLPATRAAAEQERDRIKALLDAVRDPRGGVFLLPRRPEAA